jgi:hypothetical protein
MVGVQNIIFSFSQLRKQRGKWTIYISNQFSVCFLFLFLRYKHKIQRSLTWKWNCSHFKLVAWLTCMPPLRNNVSSYKLWKNWKLLEFYCFRIYMVLIGKVPISSEPEFTNMKNVIDALQQSHNFGSDIYLECKQYIQSHHHY